MQAQKVVYLNAPEDARKILKNVSGRIAEAMLREHGRYALTIAGIRTLLIIKR